MPSHGVCQVSENLPERGIPEDLSPTVMEIVLQVTWLWLWKWTSANALQHIYQEEAFKALPGIVQGEGRGDARLS